MEQERSHSGDGHGAAQIVYTLRGSVHPPLLAARAAQRLRQGSLLWLFCSWVPHTPGCFTPTARAGVPGELGGVRSHTRASRFDPGDKAVLPKLRPAVAFSTNHSTHWTLPTMSHFLYSPPLFRWMLDFAHPCFYSSQARQCSSKSLFCRISSLCRLAFWLYNLNMPTDLVTVLI